LQELQGFRSSGVAGVAGVAGVMRGLPVGYRVDIITSQYNVVDVSPINPIFPHSATPVTPELLNP
jgi:hypothetical protein